MPAAPDLVTEFELRGGRRVVIRPARAADAASVAEAMRTASAATLRNRFLVAFHGLPEEELRQRLEVTSPDECCLVAALGDRVIGGVRLVRTTDPVTAEFAITVHDEFQKQGLGTALMRCLVTAARARGIRRLVGEALNDNQGILSLVTRLGPVRVTRSEPGVRHLELPLDPLGH
jgi:acetyltransferase